LSVELHHHCADPSATTGRRFCAATIQLSKTSKEARCGCRESNPIGPGGRPLYRRPGCHSQQHPRSRFVPQVRIELTSPVYETGALPVSYKGARRRGVEPRPLEFGARAARRSAAHPHTPRRGAHTGATLYRTQRYSHNRFNPRADPSCAPRQGAWRTEGVDVRITTRAGCGREPATLVACRSETADQVSAWCGDPKSKRARTPLRILALSPRMKEA
jgi:hypothetical protein